MHEPKRVELPQVMVTHLNYYGTTKAKAKGITFPAKPATLILLFNWFDYCLGISRDRARNFSLSFNDSSRVKSYNT